MCCALYGGVIESHFPEEVTVQRSYKQVQAQRWEGTECKCLEADMEYLLPQICNFLSFSVWLCWVFFNDFCTGMTKIIDIVRKRHISNFIL